MAAAHWRLTSELNHIWAQFSIDDLQRYSQNCRSTHWYACWFVLLGYRLLWEVSALLLPHLHLPFYPTGQPAIHQAWTDRSHALSHTNKPYGHQNQLERDHDREKERANMMLFMLTSLLPSTWSNMQSNAWCRGKCCRPVKRWKKSDLGGLLWPALQWLKEEVMYCSCCPEPESCYQTMVFEKSFSCWFLWI